MQGHPCFEQNHTHQVRLLGPVNIGTFSRHGEEEGRRAWLQGQETESPHGDYEDGELGQVKKQSHDLDFEGFFHIYSI